ncbi:MAG TPA: alkaline phosphatase family protein [Labilithrix sp.]|jgi:phospholipase C
MRRLAPLFALPILFVAACSSAPDEEPGTDADALAAACAFQPGSKARSTLRDVPAAIPIEHIIIVTQENRSFDHMLGSLRLEGHDVDGIPSNFVNRDRKGVPVHFYHRTDTCFDADSPHNEEALESSIDGDRMDSFVENAATSKDDGHYVMSYYTQKELPFYHWLAKSYAISDRYFAPMIGPTDPNRDFLYAATNNGVTETGKGGMKGVRTIYDELDHAGVSWGVYSAGAPRQAALGWDRGHRGFHTDGDFFDALEDGKLPHVVFVDPGLHQDEHPPHDVQHGEQFSKKIYDAVRKSSAWASTAIFYTYDEGGGIADHVSPPSACPPSPALAKFDRLGVRVPVTVVSPWARRGFVSHATHSHTSILRFVELVFDLPALTARDANSDAMLDMFDFTAPGNAPSGPSAGHGACVNDPAGGFFNNTAQDIANDADSILHGHWPF